MSRLEEIEARKLEIREELEATEEVEKVEELNKEVDALNEEVQQIEEHEEEQQVAEEIEEAPVVPEVIKEEKKNMDNKELRNSKEYIDAYAEYVKTGSDKELRALYTTNATEVTGSVDVPQVVEDIVRTAWQREDLMQLVRTLSVKGNLKVQFEVSSSDAQVHLEGADEPVSEEELVLGIAELKPVSIKKWIGISDEVVDMRGEAFLRYIYDELTYRIAKKCADTLVSAIAGLPQTATASSPSANKLTLAPAVGTIANAIANLSDEANNPVIIMNKLTYGKFKEVAYANGYSVDPFEGLRVIFNNTLPAYDSASAGNVYAIVGDLGFGAVANFPNGEGVEIKYDETTLMTDDIVRILGRRFVGMGVVADKSFTLIAKPQ